jgi:repressor of nif and glnA expression
MTSFKVEEMEGDSAVREMSVVAFSRIHAVMKTVARPIKAGLVPGKRSIRVTQKPSGLTGVFHFTD